MSSQRRVDEQIMVRSYNGILLGNRKELTTDTHSNTNESQKHTDLLKKKTDTKEYVLHDSIYMRSGSRQN